MSLMPADNIDGFRPEVIAVLKQLRFGVLRFPGGNFVSAYEWRYGVGESTSGRLSLTPCGTRCNRTTSVPMSS